MQANMLLRRLNAGIAVDQGIALIVEQMLVRIALADIPVVHLKNVHLFKMYNRCVSKRGEM